MIIRDILLIALSFLAGVLMVFIYIHEKNEENKE